MRRRGILLGDELFLSEEAVLFQGGSELLREPVSTSADVLLMLVWMYRVSYDGRGII